MAEPTGDQEERAGRSAEGESESGVDSPDTPRWVKIFGLVAAGLLILFVIVHLSGGGFRGHALP
jgi:hypothetical protein